VRPRAVISLRSEPGSTDPSSKRFARVLAQILTRPRNAVVLVATLFATAEIGAAATPIADPDVWWVAAAGRLMLSTRRVPTQNVFSFVEPTHPWIMHEWLFGPPYAWGLDHFGPSVFVALTIAFLSLDLGLVLAATLGRARHAFAGLFMAFVAVGGFGVRFLSARPTHVALEFPLAMTLVAFAPSFSLSSIGIAGLIQLVWTNAHGSFPLGVLLVLLSALDNRRDRARRLGAATLCAAVTCVNPYGLALHRFVWDYLSGRDGIYREIHHHVTEFGNLMTAWGTAVVPADVAALAFGLVLSVAAAFVPQHRLRAAMCIAMFVWGALQVRHLQLAGLLTCVLLLPYVDELAQRWRLPQPVGADWVRGAMAATLVPACAAGVGLFVVEHWLRDPADWIKSGRTFEQSMDHVPEGANLYIPFQWAGSAIAMGFPRGVRVLFDPRNDCYSASTFRMFTALGARGAPPSETRERLTTTGTNAVVVDDEHPLVAFLKKEAGWKLLARPGPWRVYGREP
jgi:hypothetical protein